MLVAKAGDTWLAQPHGKRMASDICNTHASTTPEFETMNPNPTHFRHFHITKASNGPQCDARQEAYYFNINKYYAEDYLYISVCVLIIRLRRHLNHMPHKGQAFDKALSARRRRIGLS